MLYGEERQCMEFDLFVNQTEPSLIPAVYMGVLKLFTVYMGGSSIHQE